LDIDPAVGFSDLVIRFSFFVPFWWEVNLIQPEEKSVWKFHKKLKRDVPYKPTYIQRSINQ
jgi:hypothetical protein